MTAVVPDRSESRRRFSPLSLVEALVTPHGVDRYLELVNPMWTVRELRAEVTDVRRRTDDTVTLTLRPTRQWRGFEAGQFVQVTVLIDGVRRTRCYSPACSQYRADGCLELTIKAHPDGLVSRYLHSDAEPGLVVGLSQADGTFRLPAHRPDRLLLISGGSGITPVLSMLRTLCDEGHTGQIAFLHYARTEADVVYRDELRALAASNTNLRLALAYTDAGNGDLTGHFAGQHLEAAAPWYADAETFLCGPPGLMRAVREHFEALGLSDGLHTEDFAPARLAVDPDEISGAVTFDRSGVTAGNTGATLLEQAEAAGLNPEYGCRMGICFSCTQVKASGCTRNILTGETNDDSDTEIRLCISAPVGDVAIQL